MLTPRETEVMELLKSGYTNKEIANKLHVSPHTAKAHVAEILRKFGVKNRLLAVMKVCSGTSKN